jgi:predicted DnaQ family exonuclease/DinG family helicase
LKPTYVALDLETTGLDAENDSIIEIGAIRFSEDEGEIDRFSTLVNPRRPLPRAVENLTGISESELAAAPPLEVVALDFEKFLRGAAIVGHNVTGFDLPVLDRAGIAHAGAVHDTNEIALLVMPGRDEYSLEALCRDARITNESPHRALSDAEASMELFLHLQTHTRMLPASVLAQVAEWLADTPHAARTFFAEIAGGLGDTASRGNGDWRIEAPQQAPALKRKGSGAKADASEALRTLDAVKARRDVLPEFEERAEQRTMTEAVAQAFDDDAQPLVVEAGTGTGKSLAYLIPAANHALATGDRVIVSTATINLQEQLLRKDLPAVHALVEGRGEDFRACQLKGRRNYLCLARFHAQKAAGPQSDAEALLASRILIWLTQTQTGDRSELRLTQAEEAVWSRLSADGAECNSSSSPYVIDGTCFLQRARREAESSHVVVVNHSLLLSNAAVGGTVLPPFDRLIIDEAHHLEDEATRQFGFASGERDIIDMLERCEGLAPQVQAGLRTLTLALGPHAELTNAAREVQQASAAVRPRLTEFCGRLIAFLSEHGEAGGDGQRLLVTRSTRAQPDWSDIEISWENLKLTLQTLTQALKGQAMAQAADGAGEMVNIEILRTEVDLLLQGVQERVIGLSSAIEQDDPERIVWLERARADGTPIVSWVPLAVDGMLQDRVYDGLRTVVLTGATLSSGDDPSTGFAYIQQRLGLMDAKTLALGSPFDYKRAALVLLPQDMAEPNETPYLQQLAATVTDVISASQGRALVLFTSHADLRRVHEMTVDALKREGVVALAQGVDGSPRQLVRQLQSTEACAVYGTASFWEGVDIPGDALSLLVMARLPFNVPSEPVFAARSAAYDDPFNEYGLPQAVLRFKQGFGRLIRSRTDRGVIVVLDRRITSRAYGATFLDALPACTRKIVPVRMMAENVAQWLATGSVEPAPSR